MAKRTFKGRPILPGKLEGKALVSRQAFNTTASYLENMFAGRTDSAPCTDVANKELHKKDLSGAYQHITYVFRSEDPYGFDGSRELCRLSAHAPEIFQDERGDWHISSAEWPHRGVSVAPLVWE